LRRFDVRVWFVVYVDPLTRDIDHELVRCRCDFVLCDYIAVSVSLSRNQNHKHYCVRTLYALQDIVAVQ
jgi:hypothetical protein